MSTQPFTITVFSKNQCYKCNSLMKNLDKKNLEYTEINVQQDTTVYPEFDNKTAMNYIVDLGYLEMPVTEIRDENGSPQDLFSGLRPDKIMELQQLATSSV